MKLKPKITKVSLKMSVNDQTRLRILCSNLMDHTGASGMVIGFTLTTKDLQFISELQAVLCQKLI